MRILKYVTLFCACMLVYVSFGETFKLTMVGYRLGWITVALWSLASLCGD